MDMSPLSMLISYGSASRLVLCKKQPIPYYVFYSMMGSKNHSSLKLLQSALHKNCYDWDKEYRKKMRGNLYVLLRLNEDCAKSIRTNGLIAYESLDAGQIHTLARE